MTLAVFLLLVALAVFIAACIHGLATRAISVAILAAGLAFWVLAQLVGVVHLA